MAVWQPGNSLKGRPSWSLVGGRLPTEGQPIDEPISFLLPTHFLSWLRVNAKIPFKC